MSRFQNNTLQSGYAQRQPNTINLAGGTAWAQDAEMELASLVSTSMVTDQYYRSPYQSLARLRELVGKVDPVFAAKAAVYVRNEDGLRSISHAVAGEIAHAVRGEQWTKDFYRAVVRRPDDITEILAYYLDRYKKPLPNSLKKGLGSAFGKFDEYQLAKYRGESNALSLVDAVNLVHPRPTGKNAEALAKLVNGTLRSTGTWETKLSAAGSDKEAKAEAWADLLRDGTIGYFALLKNLRNIAEQAPELVGRAIELLTDGERVRKSLVLPFRFVTAMAELDAYPAYKVALSQALDLSLANIPDLGENILIAVDGSGSMGSAAAGNPNITCKMIGSIFAAALYKKTGADVLVFGDTAGPVHGLNPADTTMTIAHQIFRTSYGYSTNFHSIFDRASRGHDTVVIFSDMQAWVDGGYYASDPRPSFESYKRRYKVAPKVFAFDLTGYGSAQFPAKDICEIAGFSDKSFALMAQLREDPRALVNRIKAVDFSEY
jgi:60 kDa SS-A/Ro ribonucleoprotein